MIKQLIALWQSSALASHLPFAALTDAMTADDAQSFGRLLRRHLNIVRKHPLQQQILMMRMHEHILDSFARNTACEAEQHKIIQIWQQHQLHVPTEQWLVSLALAGHNNMLAWLSTQHKWPSAISSFVLGLMHILDKGDAQMRTQAIHHILAHQQPDIHASFEKCAQQWFNKRQQNRSRNLAGHSQSMMSMLYAGSDTLWQVLVDRGSSATFRQLLAQPDLKINDTHCARFLHRNAPIDADVLLVLKRDHGIDLECAAQLRAKELSCNPVWLQATQVSSVLDFYNPSLAHTWKHAEHMHHAEQQAQVLQEAVEHDVEHTSNIVSVGRRKM